MVSHTQDFEACALGAAARGLLDLSTINPRDLSKQGRVILEALSRFEPGKERSPESILAMAVDVMGQDADPLRPLLNSMYRAGSAISAPELLRLVKEKQALVQILDIATSQLGNGHVDLAAIADYASAQEEPSTELVPLADTLERFEEMPWGYRLSSLPILSDLAGGVSGLWVIGGMAGVGKTTLCMQIALEVGQSMKVLYHDFENLANDMGARVSMIFKGNLAKAKEHTSQIYMRDDMSTFNADLAAIPPPALVVVDSLQKMPTTVKDRRIAMEAWVYRLQRLTKQGYTVLAVSELSKAAYHEGARQGNFKETGAIDYAATVGINLLEDEDTLRLVHCHIVKNRNRPFRGEACTLYPNKDRGNWWFDEDPVRA